MSKKADEFGVPYPEHERAEWTEPKGGFLETRIAEVRGLRTYRRNIYRNPEITAAEASLATDAPDSVFEQLQAIADGVLQEAGEKTSLETLNALDDDRAPSGLPGLDLGSAALLIQRDDIAKKHGWLSREVTASHFLTVSRRLNQMFDLRDEATLNMLTAWADAWYWLRFEESGAHGLSIAGIKALDGRRAGPEAKAKAKAVREGMLREEFAKLDPRDQLWLDAACVELLAPLAQRFTSAKHAPYTAKTLRKEISRLKLVAKAKKVRAGL